MVVELGTKGLCVACSGRGYRLNGLGHVGACDEASYRRRCVVCHGSGFIRLFFVQKPQPDHQDRFATQKHGSS